MESRSFSTAEIRELEESFVLGGFGVVALPDNDFGLATELLADIWNS